MNNTSREKQPMSGPDAVAKVLAEATEPLSIDQIVDPKYRVGGKGKPMPLKEALAKANQVHLKTGVFAAVEQVAPKPLTGRQFWDKSTTAR